MQPTLQPVGQRRNWWLKYRPYGYYSGYEAAIVAKPEMDFRYPFRVVTPTLDGEVLRVLAGTTGGLTGREIVRLVGLKTHEGTRRVLERLVSQGIVVREPVGRAFSYTLNRDHVAAPYVEGLARLRAELIARLRQRIADWETPPLLAALFGSAARGDAGPESDVDLLVIRPAELDPDADHWRRQLLDVEASTAAWTGNDARVLEYGEHELRAAAQAEPVLREVAAEGIELYGDLGLLRRATRTRPPS
jgi:nucleotidyltransferase-like protein